VALTHPWGDALKIWLQLPAAAGDSDDLLELVLTQTIRAANRYMKRYLIDPGADITEDHDGQGDSKVWVKYPPILTVTALYDDPNRDFGASTIIAADQYYVDQGQGMIELMSQAIFGTLFATSQRNVRIVYRPGLAQDADELVDLQLAVFKWVGKLFMDSEKKLHNVKAISSTAGNVTLLLQKMPDDAREIFNQHRFIDYPDPS